jgi:predicted secreted hydrolase
MRGRWLITCIPVLAVVLAGCDRPERPPSDSAPVRLDERMGATPDPGFARALAQRPFVFPADHGPHPDYATEWWYLTGNLQDPSGAAFGYQLTLFRIGLEPGEPANDSAWRTHQVYMGHLAVSDIGGRRHHSASRFERAALGLAGARADPLAVWLGPWSIRGQPGGPFPLRLEAAGADFAIDLSVAAGERPLVLQGDRGLSQKSAAPGNASHYYSYTRLPTEGEIRIGDRRWQVAGHSWFDREWSSSALGPDQAGWDWFALHLEDGRDLMYYRMRGIDGQAQSFSQGVLVASDGSVTRLSADQVEAVPRRTWTGPTGNTYPVAWRLRIPDQGLDLSVEAAFDAQEMRHAVEYWEGAVRVSGSHRGVGYLEMSGYAR